MRKIDTQAVREDGLDEENNAIFWQIYVCDDVCEAERRTRMIERRWSRACQGCIDVAVMDHGSDKLSVLIGNSLETRNAIMYRQ